MDWQSIAIILVPILSVLGWIWSRIDRRFDKIDLKFEKIESEIKDVKTSLESEIKEIRTSLNRMEGAFYSKDCMLKEDKYKKAE